MMVGRVFGYYGAVLRESEVTKSSFTTALVAGFAFHGVVLLNLLVDKSGWVAG